MTTLATLMRGTGYGFDVAYMLRLEGVSVLFGERDETGVCATAGYTYDASLSIGASAQIGSIVDREAGIGRGFDLTVQLLDTSAVRSLIAISARCRLTADVAPADVTISVDDATGFDASGSVAIGRELIPYSGTTATSFTGCTRGTYGRAYAHTAASAIGTSVTQAPLYLIGRRADLFAYAVDPFGVTIPSDPIAEGTLVWSGYVVEPPEPEDGTWTLACRSLDRRLDLPVLPEITGAARWSLDADPIVVLTAHHKWAQLRVYFASTASAGTRVDEAWTIRPWRDRTVGGGYRLSALRADVSAAWAAAVGATAGTYVTSALEWQSEVVAEGAAVSRVWRPYIIADLSAVAARVVCYVRVDCLNGTPILPFADASALGNPANDPRWVTYVEYDGLSHAAVPVGCTMTARVGVQSAALEVTVDEGDPADVPTSGWVELDGDGGSDVYRYTAAWVDDASPGTVHLAIDPSTSPDLPTLALADGAGDAAEISARIITRLSGSPADTMRTLIESGGRADNGTFDTETNGLDIEVVNEDSFDAACDGLFGLLSADLAVSGEETFASLFGGLLALSGRAVVQDSEGNLRAISTGHPSSGYSVAVISDTDLAVGPGSTPPIRVLRQYRTPSQIVSKLTRGGDDAGTITTRDTDRFRAEPERQWQLEIPGYTRQDLLTPATEWSRSLFASGRSAQAVEVDCVPFLADADGTLVDVSPGDAVYLSTTHWAVYSRETGRRGYTGWARVLGRQIDLASGLQTLTLLVDGLVVGGSLSPSAPIASWGGAASAATYVEITGTSYLPIFKRWLRGVASCQVQAYLPGSDVTTYRYTVTAATEVSGNTRLTISAQTGTFTITTSWRITAPVTGQCNTAQTSHMHTDSTFGWS